MKSFNNNNKGVTKKSSPNRNKKNLPVWNPFTKVQLKEFERQIMIYKHFMACVSVPSYLLSYIPTSSRGNITDPMTASSSTNTDPMEGRCKRTDGKKWRCPGCVAPNNKYCDRHMYRGTRRSRKSVELCNNDTRYYSSYFLPSTSSHPYLQPSVSVDNHSFCVKIAPRIDHSNKQSRMVNGDPMSHGASNSGWNNNVLVNVNQSTKSLPQYNTLVYNPLLVPPTSENSKGNNSNSSVSVENLSFSSLDPYSMMGPLGEILWQSKVTSNPDESITKSGT